MKQGKGSTILLVVLLVAGFSLLLYPTVSDFWNSLHQSRAMVQYTDQVEQLDPAQCAQLWADAEAYNRTLLDNADRFVNAEQEGAAAAGLLTVSDVDVIGRLEIPSIDVSLPIYHGTSEAVLQAGVGNLEGSSLPTGGAGTHCVLSGHRGLPSARLLTDLDKLAQGDTFTLRVLDRTMTYQVDQILVVEPYEMDALAIDPSQDYCTLVTCTPYGINTHRLLVRGHRIAAAAGEETSTAHSAQVTADAVQIDTLTLAPLAAAPLLLLLLFGLLYKVRGRRHPRKGRP